MVSDITTTKRKMPKGGRKGGAKFPRIELDLALKYATKLVSKTHAGRLEVDIVYAGVVGTKSGEGDVRISALKQFGLIEGDKKMGFMATDLAKKIASAPPDEIQKLFQRAALLPKIFSDMFKTFHGDTVASAKLKQRAADLRVHPEETATCVETYVKSLEFAGFLSREGEKIRHQAGAGLELGEIEQAEGGDEDVGEGGAENEESGLTGKLGPESEMQKAKAGRVMPRAVFHVNVNLDASLDTEKLAKQLELLKRYGAI